MSNTTFCGNTVYDSSGGSIRNLGAGALTVSNSTFSSNSAESGGGIINGGTLSVSNTTFSHNSAEYGGNINGEHALTLKNTIVADGPPGNNCAGAITDGGGNLSYPDTTCPGVNADPPLGPLQDNGGPAWTMALGPGSAAIDAGIDAICAADPVNNRDQRGVVRPRGAHCDIGALEQLRKWLPIVLVE